MRHKSGYAIEVDIITTDNLYTSGVFIINPDGLATQRITIDQTIYRTNQEAIEASKVMGKVLLSRHLSGQEPLYFEYVWSQE
ncbi:hypothetical protein [Pseudomonas fragi]|uniref:hypothetical protein n=1 Tax=Pseudomonas fragi TaxID=296 RepID=UPI0029545DCA|nr:hypothetical protein [Pseudomonas fragi]WOL28228.1 hypothetical protein Q1A94_00885 [Pseudomonas fragi]